MVLLARNDKRRSLVLYAGIVFAVVEDGISEDYRYDTTVLCISVELGLSCVIEPCVCSQEVVKVFAIVNLLLSTAFHIVLLDWLTRAVDVFFFFFTFC